MSRVVFTKENITAVMEYHAKHPRRGAKRTWWECGVDAPTELDPEAVQDIFDIVKANKGITPEEVLNKITFKLFDEMANTPSKDDTFESFKPCSASFDLDENGDVIEEPLEKIGRFAHKTIDMQKRLNEEEDHFLNEHGLRGKSCEVQIRRYLFYILKELKKLTTEQDVQQDLIRRH